MKKLFFAFIVSAAALAMQSTSHAQGKVNSSMIVSTEWLAKHLNDDSLVLLQVGDKKEYDEAHIAGAQFIQISDISTPRGQGLILELPGVDQLKPTFDRFGVTDKSRIVIYFSKDWVSPTARVFMTLDYLGLRPHVNSRRGLASVACREPAGDRGVAETQSRSLNTATKHESCGRRLMG